MKKLPNNPSDLIMLALKDLVLIEKNKKYTVNMGAWHTPNLGRK